MKISSALSLIFEIFKWEKCVINEMVGQEFGLTKIYLTFQCYATFSKFTPMSHIVNSDQSLLF